MGVFYETCKCGKTYMWFSHTPADIVRSKQCDDCWRKEGVDPNTFKVVKEEGP